MQVKLFIHALQLADGRPDERLVDQLHFLFIVLVKWIQVKLNSLCVFDEDELGVEEGNDLMYVMGSV